jgi:arylsulfatase
MKTSILLTTTLTLASLAISASSLLANTRPNVVIVMTDDQGYPELSVHGNPILQTPHLDRLHGQSLRLSDFHVTPMCTPTRGQLLTGIDAVRNGAANVSSGRALIRPELPTMANFFGSAGYATGVFGKWHLGANYPYRPQDRGFQESVWFPSSSIPSVPAYWGNDYFDDVYTKNGKLEQFEGYCTDVFFGEAKGFMANAAQAGKPFLCYIAPNTPHGPLIPKPKDRAVIAKRLEDPQFDHFDKKLKQRLAAYLGMIINIDDNVGELMQFLDDKGLADNTILIFMTDNGSTHGPEYYNAGMRGSKTELWEGGHRVPFFIRWPDGHLAVPQDIGGLTQVQDILPTLLDLCGIEPASDPDFDGMSLAPVFQGKEQVSDDRVLVINYSRMPGFSNFPSPYSQTQVSADQAGVLWKHWRLLENRELYDLESDPLQQTNVIDQYPEVVEKMRADLDAWWEKAGPSANEVQRIIIGSEHENPTKLSATEWLDVFIDQQGQIRRGDQKSGYWMLDVAEAGEYEIELRRWPKETDAPISGTLSDGSGKALPIKKASLYFAGHNHMSISQKRPYSFEGLTKTVREGDKGIVFTMQLKEGPTALHTWYHGENDTMLSAYYVYITKK